MRQPFRASLLSIAMLSIVVGCSGAPEDQPDLGQVTGTITVDGQPRSGLQVSFQPENGRPSIGRTNDEGVYVLKYTESEDGAKVGKGVIRINTASSTEEDEGYGEENASGETGASYGEEHTDVIPAQYNAQAVDNPDMNVEVKPGENTFDFQIQTDAAAG